jgi:PQQ-dependent catabolism-associated CXXCW motif protein
MGTMGGRSAAGGSSDEAMTNAAANPYDVLSAELRALSEQEGDDIWRNRNRLMGLLLDHQPDLRREIRTIVSGVEQGVARALADSERSLAAIAIDRQASLMETEIGLRPEVAQNVTRAIAHALDLGPLPSIYVTERRPPPGLGQAPPPQAARPPAVPPSQSWPAPPTSQAMAYGTSSIGQRPRRVPWAAVGILGGAALAALLIILIPHLTGRGASGNQVAVPIAPQVPQGYANELMDFNVPPQATLRSPVGGATPLAIEGGRRITTSDLTQLLARDPDTELIDVLGDVHVQTIANAHYLPTAGQPGTFQDQAQESLRQALERLTDGDMARAVVFFCLGANCWESYNAVLRARALGYTNLYWYRGGLQAWQQAGLPFQPLPAPGAG